jgi:hypothetical protein
VGQPRSRGILRFDMEDAHRDICPFCLLVCVESGATSQDLCVRETNMARNSFTSVASLADSPEPLLRLSPATGHDAEMPEV